MAAAPTVFLGRCPSRTAKAVGQWRPASAGEHSVIIRAPKLLGIGAGFSATMLTGNTFRGFHRGCHDVPSASIPRRFDAPSSDGSHSGCRCIGECGKHEIACADRAFGAQFESRRDDVAAPHDRYISRRCTSKARHSSALGQQRPQPQRPCDLPRSICQRVVGQTS
jgi:hypothetical protein